MRLETEMLRLDEALLRGEARDEQVSRKLLLGTTAKWLKTNSDAVALRQQGAVENLADQIPKLVADWLYCTAPQFKWAESGNRCGWVFTDWIFSPAIPTRMEVASC